MDIDFDDSEDEFQPRPSENSSEGESESSISGLVWSRGLIHLLRLVYYISRTNELIQAAG